MEKAAAARGKFCAAMDDDLNTPDALAALFDFVREINTLAPQSSRAALEAAADAFDALTGVLGILYNRKKDEIPADILALVDERAGREKGKGLGPRRRHPRGADGEGLCGGGYSQRPESEPRKISRSIQNT